MTVTGTGKFRFQIRWQSKLRPVRRQLKLAIIPPRRFPVFLHKYRYRIFRFFWDSIFRDAPDIRPDNPAFFDIRYPAGYHLPCRISGKAGYRISGYCLADPIINLVFLHIRLQKIYTQITGNLVKSC
jgi:hypothetical protein